MSGQALEKDDIIVVVESCKEREGGHLPGLVMPTTGWMSRLQPDPRAARTVISLCDLCMGLRVWNATMRLHDFAAMEARISFGVSVANLAKLLE